MRLPTAAALLLALAAGCQPDAPDPALGPVPEVFQQQKAQCEKRGGRWGEGSGGGFYVCYRYTSDGGKYCKQAGDCQSMCLARSHTCAPVTPLYGCQQVLNALGAEEQLCLE